MSPRRSCEDCARHFPHMERRSVGGRLRGLRGATLRPWPAPTSSSSTTSPRSSTTLQKALTLEGYARRRRRRRQGRRGEAQEAHLRPLPLRRDAPRRRRRRAPRSACAAAKVDTPVIMMSGHATIDTAVRAVRVGALNFLEKPLNTDALLIAVETALRLDRAEAEARGAARARAGTTGELVGESPAIKKLVEQIGRAAKSAASVLVTGERGTGKELVARAIHTLSARARRGRSRSSTARRCPSELIETRALRPRGGRVHRRDQAAARQVRARDGRHALPRRGRRHAARDAGEAPARAAGARDRARRRATRRSRSTCASSRRRTATSSRRARRAPSAPTSTTGSTSLPLAIPPLRARREDIPLLARHFLELAAQRERPPRHAPRRTTRIARARRLLLARATCASSGTSSSGWSS